MQTSIHRDVMCSACSLFLNQVYKTWYRANCISPESVASSRVERTGYLGEEITPFLNFIRQCGSPWLMKCVKLPCVQSCRLWTAHMHGMKQYRQRILESVNNSLTAFCSLAKNLIARKIKIQFLFCSCSCTGRSLLFFAFEALASAGKKACRTLLTFFKTGAFWFLEHHFFVCFRGPYKVETQDMSRRHWLPYR